jgi:hypothetical protein
MTIDYSKIFEDVSPELIHLTKCEKCKTHAEISELAHIIISGGISDTVYGEEFGRDNIIIDITNWIMINHAIPPRPRYADSEGYTYLDIPTINEKLGFSAAIDEFNETHIRRCLICQTDKTITKLNNELMRLINVAPANMLRGLSISITQKDISEKIYNNHVVF